MTDPTTPGRRLGDFELIRELGSGGMGTVWEAVQISLGRRVALKLLAPHISMSSTSLKRFQREAEAGARITHPNIVAVFQVGEEDGVNYIAQELVPGGASLANHLSEVAKYEGLPSDYYSKITQLFLKSAEALQASHEAGIIHRDVKPGNILLTQDGQPKIADFGLAQIEDALELSRTGEFSGTPYYMSPEQAMSKRMGLDQRSDIFSLGASFWEALALRRPFEGDSSYQVLQKIITENPGPPKFVRENCPQALSQICMKALEKNPDARYQSMQELIEDLSRYLAGEEVLAPSQSTQTIPVTASEKKAPSSSKMRFCLLACAFITLPVLAIVGVVFFLFTGPSEAQHEATTKIEETEREALAAAETVQRQKDANTGFPSALSALQEVTDLLDGLEKHASSENLKHNLRFFPDRLEIAASSRRRRDDLRVYLSGHLLFNSKALSGADATFAYFGEVSNLIPSTTIIESESQWGKSTACECGECANTRIIYGTYKFSLKLPLLPTDSDKRLSEIDLIQHLAEQFPSGALLEMGNLSSPRTRPGVVEWDYASEDFLPLTDWHDWLSRLQALSNIQVVPTTIKMGQDVKPRPGVSDHSLQTSAARAKLRCGYLRNISDPPDLWWMNVTFSRSGQSE